MRVCVPGRAILGIGEWLAAFCSITWRAWRGLQLFVKDAMGIFCALWHNELYPLEAIWTSEATT